MKNTSSREEFMELPIRLEAYTDYYKMNRPACVGLSRIGFWNLYACYADGSSIRASRIWALLPRAWVSYNQQGICFSMKKKVT